MGGLSAEASGGADAGEFDRRKWGAIEREAADLRAGVLHVIRDEEAADLGDRAEGFF